MAAADPNLAAAEPTLVGSGVGAQHAANSGTASRTLELQSFSWMNTANKEAGRTGRGVTRAVVGLPLGGSKGPAAAACSSSSRRDMPAEAPVTATRGCGC